MRFARDRDDGSRKAIAELQSRLCAEQRREDEEARKRELTEAEQ